MRGSAGLTLTAQRAQGLLGLLCLLGGLALAWRHPVAPWVAGAGVLAMAAIAARRPLWAVAALGALLPVLDFLPWTGDTLINEADLLLLAVAAGAWLRPPPRQMRAGALARGLWWLLGLLAWVGLVRGWLDASALAGLGDPWHADASSPWHALRQSKGWLALWVLAPWLVLLGPAALRPWLLGLLAGLVWVVGGVLLERAAYPGLLDFSRPYRSVGTFWDMHLGGGAIDAYLALTVPLAAWALWVAPRGWRWWASLALWWGAMYAVLVTYSRGVVLATLIAVLTMAAVAWAWRWRPTRGALTAWCMGLALALQVGLVWLSGQALAERMGRGQADLLARWAHWGAVLALPQGLGEQVLGMGAGRLPDRYRQQVAGGEWPGAAQWTDEQGQARVRLQGPPTRPDLLSRWALMQRLGDPGPGPWRLRVRASGEGAGLMVSLCERHLLHDLHCRWRSLRLDGVGEDAPGWHGVQLGRLPATKAGGIERAQWLALYPAHTGQQVEMESVELWDAGGQQRLANPAFTQGLAHWVPVATGYYQPWHADSVWVELKAERGWLGVLGLVGMVAWAVVALGSGLRRRDPMAWALGGSLVACGALSFVISVTEFQRVMLLWAIQSLAIGLFMNKLAKSGAT